MAGLWDLEIFNLKNLTSDFESNPVHESWFLMSSPLPVLFISASYLYFVLVAGPRYMAKREPFNLNKILIVYNFIMVIFSVWICSRMFTSPRMSLQVLQMTCKPFDSKMALEFASSSWWYFITKNIELLDTVFFVLRKKQDQVSFLHVYHHCVMASFTWLFIKHFPGEAGAFFGGINTVVHVVMYFYYMVSAMGPKYQKYIWWKKYLTRMQLSQFIIILAYVTCQFYNGCHLPKILIYFSLFNILVFLVLFADFYVKEYGQNKTKIRNRSTKVLQHTQ